MKGKKKENEKKIGGVKKIKTKWNFGKLLQKNLLTNFSFFFFFKETFYQHHISIHLAVFVLLQVTYSIRLHRQKQVFFFFFVEAVH